MDSDLMRVIDAELNRAGEGLRVVEDYVRFVLDDPLLAEETKRLRHEFADLAHTIATQDRHAARDTLADVGTRISTDSEATRGDIESVCAASLKRTQQSLRSLEEFGKLINSAFAARCETMRYRLYTLEKAIDVGALSRERLGGVTLCVLVDARKSAAEFEQLVRALVDTGVGMIQLREKHLDDRELVTRARQLRDLTRGTQSLAIINDRADIAVIVGADGVHLGQEDLTVKDARAIVGTRMLLGISTHNISQARAAVLDGANYLGAGPTFPSQTKAFDDFAGSAYLREIAAEIRLPIFAIGGISADNLPEVLATGIARIAVGAAVTDAREPGVAAGKLLGMLKDSPVGPAAPSQA